MKELLQQALDALMLDHSEGLTVQEGQFLDSTAAAIRAALAEHSVAGKINEVEIPKELT